MEKYLKHGLLNNFIFILVKHSFFSKRRSNASLFVALLGVSVGIFSLIAIVGTMNGMQSLLIDDLVAVESYDYQGTAPVKEIDERVEKIEATSQVSLVVPFIDEFAFVQTDNSSTVLHLRALYSKKVNEDSLFLSSISLNPNKNNQYFNSSHVKTESEKNIPHIIIGWSSSGKLAVSKGDMVLLTLPGQGNGFLPLQTQAKVSEVFYSASEYDYRWAFMSLEDYAMLVQNNIDTIHYGVRVHSHKGIRETLSQYLEDVASWQERNSAFFIALKTEKTILVLLSAVIFCIIVLHFRFSMLRRIKNKKDDIVSLRTMGATPQQITQWFFGETIIIGIIGTILGICVGLVYLYKYSYLYEKAVNYFGGYLYMAIPQGGTIRIRELVLIVCFTWIALLWSSWFVIKRSVTITPMQVLRYE